VTEVAPVQGFRVSRVVRSISRGGFGRVEEVELEDGSRVARKTFDPQGWIAADTDAREQARRRFVREVSVQSHLDHPHVMPILHAELTASPPWFLMPLADRSLVEQIRDDRANTTITLEPLTQMLAGLEELHRLGYVHRDLKPPNVLRLDGRWVITDLGFVLPPSGSTVSLTRTVSAWGTEEYAAPEARTEFHTVRAEADVYSVGCILHDYVLQTPRVPYAQCTDTGPLGVVIEKCTASRPRDRFRDVAALRSALVLMLGAQPTATAGPQVAAWIDELRNDPTAITEQRWEEIARYVDVNGSTQDAGLLLYALDGPQIVACYERSEADFQRLSAVITRWVREGNFDFEFCDVLGARLARIFERGGTREKADSILAAFHLGYSHNRWAIMRLFFRLAAASLPTEIAERLSIEFLAIGWQARVMLEHLERGIGATRTSLHPLLQVAVDQIDSPGPPAF